MPDEDMRSFDALVGEGDRDKLLREFRRYDTLLKNSSMLNSTLTLDQALRLVLEQACRLMESKTASIFLYNDTNRTLEFAATTDPNVTDLKSIQVPMDKGISGHVFRTGETVNIGDIREDDRYFKDVDDALKRTTRAYLCVPLMIQQKITGTAQIMDREDDGVYTAGDERLMRAFANQAASAIERARLYDQKLEKERLEKENMRMKTELDVARNIQTMLLPREKELARCRDLEIAYRMDPASEVGGDFLEVLPRPDTTVFFAIGDVTDHGLLSGIITLMTQSSFRTLIENFDLSLTDILLYINMLLFHNLQNRMRINLNLTLMLLRYRDGALSFAGQHESILVFRRESGGVEVIDTGELGIYIGLIENIKKHVAEKSILLNEGDSIVLFTDGATEAENEHGDQYGLERLVESMKRHSAKPPHDLLAAMFDDIYRWIGSATFFDDITMVAAERRVGRE
jgi:serine phosphatase RsbU (regulator of sigma subunit)